MRVSIGRETRHIAWVMSSSRRSAAAPCRDLPAPFAGWFASRGWTPREHQLAAIESVRAGEDALVIAPTGGGKTLAGFLPSLIDLAAAIAQHDGPRPHRLHTLYLSPLKALATDVARNLQTPVAEMALPVRAETRTGDTPASKRQRQRAKPPDILLTTPEQLALFIASEHAGRYFEDLRYVIIDEAHAIAPTKRGDLLALGLAALARWAPGHRRIGLSATVQDPEALARWLAVQPPDGPARAARIVRGRAGAAPAVEVLVSKERVPWAGHTGRHAFEEVYGAIKRARTALVFVNTRSQAELTFQGLWSVNEEALPIALHHGSLSVEQRRKVEGAMGRGELRAVVCTSTLDLGIDWGDVDLVVQMGAPKGSSRLIQRIGRANHRLDETSRALLAPSNRFEVLECRAAQDAVAAMDLDGEAWRSGGLDVLAQHVMGRACGEPFDALALFDELRAAAPYAELTWETFERVVDFVATGGYALKTYDRFRRIAKDPDGRWRAATPDAAQRHRMNVGVIVEEAYLEVRLIGRGKGTPSAPGSVRPKASSPYSPAPKRSGQAGRAAAKPLRGGRRIGQVEEYYVNQLAPGDTFVFAGQVLRFEGVEETSCFVTPSADPEPKVPAWVGGKFPISTFLARRVRAMISDAAQWAVLPQQVQEWLHAQARRSIIPAADDLLVETFPRAAKHYLVCYPFEGRLAHQTLGMLLTRRLERLGKRPLGFVANDYALSVWALEDMGDVALDALFEEDMLGDDLDAWLAESALMKRTFRNCALISGLIDRKRPGEEKTGRQIAFSTDLIYDVLRKHQPDHLLLEAAWHDAGAGLLDISRLGEALARVRDKIRHAKLDRVSPLAVPVMLEIGREPVYGAASEAILADASEDLIAEAMRD